MADLFDAEPMYDSDYLHFWGSGQRLDDTAPAATPGGDAVADLDLAWRLLDLQAGMRVLDLCCGHGALTNGLAERGCEVTGLDSSTVFLDRARSDAAALGVEVEYVEGDMRDGRGATRSTASSTGPPHSATSTTTPTAAYWTGSRACCARVGGWRWTSTT